MPRLEWTPRIGPDDHVHADPALPLTRLRHAHRWLARIERDESLGLTVFSTMGPLLFRSIPPQGPARVTR